MVGVALLKHTGCAVPGDVYSFALRIEGHVVIDAHAGNAGNDFACLGIKDKKLRRIAGCNKQAMIWLIKGHRVLDVSIRYRPSRDQLSFREIDNANFIREIDVHLFSGTVEDHSLRAFGWQNEVTRMLELFGINDADHVCVCSRIWAAALHVELFGDRIKLGAVDTGRQHDGIANLISLSVHQLTRTGVSAVGDQEPVGIRTKHHRMGCAKASNAVNVFAGLQIENFDCLVYFGSKKQPIALEIHRKMIEVTSEAGHRSRMQKFKRSTVLGCASHRDYQE